MKMLNKEFEKVLKDKNFALFEQEASNDLVFLKKILPYLSYGRIYKIDIKGNITQKEFIPIFKLIEMYFCANKKEALKDIFEYLVNQKSKARFKQIFRYSSTDIESVKENFFKTLFNKDINFSLRYGKELFLRSKDDFEKIILTVSLFNFSYKSCYALSLLKLIEMFPKALDELLQLFLTAYCLEYNNLYFYDKSYFIKIKENKESIESLLTKKDYEALKFHINNDYKSVLKKLFDIANKSYQNINLNYLMQLENLAYFSKKNKDEKIIKNVLLLMFIILSEIDLQTNNKELIVKEYVLKNIERILE